METESRVYDVLLSEHLPANRYRNWDNVDISRQLPDAERVIRQPRMIESADFEALWHHGGYPEPFLRRDNRFSRR